MQGKWGGTLLPMLLLLGACDSGGGGAAVQGEAPVAGVDANRGSDVRVPTPDAARDDGPGETAAALPDADTSGPEVATPDAAPDPGTPEIAADPGGEVASEVAPGDLPQAEPEPDLPMAELIDDAADETPSAEVSRPDAVTDEGTSDPGPDEPVCVPACEGVECGPDGCGGHCGTCGEHEACEAGICAAQAWCGDGACDTGSGEDCGSCDADCTCEAGTCIDGECCDPASCAELGLSCGAWIEPCGAEILCGGCPEHYQCDGGSCVYQPYCGDATCDGALGEDCDSCPGDCGCLSCEEACAPAELETGEVCGTDLMTYPSFCALKCAMGTEGCGSIDACAHLLYPATCTDACWVEDTAPISVGDPVHHFVCIDRNTNSIGYGAPVSDVTLKELVWIAYTGSCT